jgi:hypothetical protein
MPACDARKARRFFDWKPTVAATLGSNIQCCLMDAGARLIQPRGHGTDTHAPN